MRSPGCTMRGPVCGRSPGRWVGIRARSAASWPATAMMRSHLRTGRTTRRSRASRTRKDGRGSIIDAVSIHERPDDVHARLVPGHHEGDLIMGSVASNSAIGTIVERTTGYLTLVHLPDGHTAVQLAAAVAAQVTQLPEPMRKTLTWDRGSEMAAHKQLAAATGMSIYFADPYSPYQRGTNENTVSVAAAR